LGIIKYYYFTQSGVAENISCKFWGFCVDHADEALSISGISDISSSITFSNISGIFTSFQDIISFAYFQSTGCSDILVHASSINAISSSFCEIIALRSSISEIKDVFSSCKSLIIFSISTNDDSSLSSSSSVM